MKKVLRQSFFLTITNVSFMSILLLFYTNEKLGALLHQIVVFFFLILFVINFLVSILFVKFKKITFLLSKLRIFFISLILYCSTFFLIQTSRMSNDLFISLMWVTSFFISLTSFFNIIKIKFFNSDSADL